VTDPVVSDRFGELGERRGDPTVRDGRRRRGRSGRGAGSGRRRGRQSRLARSGQFV